MLEKNALTLYNLLVSSANNFCKQFGRNVAPYLDPNYMTDGIPERMLEKNDFGKN